MIRISYFKLPKEHVEDWPSNEPFFTSVINLFNDVDIAIDNMLAYVFIFIVVNAPNQI